jgi:uncharacterized protein (DUF2126 family)
MTWRGRAKLFRGRTSRRLSISPEYVVTAYEDPLAYILKERDLPVNVDPVNNKLDDPEERDRLRRVYERGLGQPVGFVLPLQRGHGKHGPEWQTGLWMLRARHLFLMPGDSPVGLRLPLQSLPWEPAESIQKLWVVDPMAPAGPLPVYAPKQRKLETIAAPLSPPVGNVVRTALTVEPRDGRMCVFFPPVSAIEDYLELLTAVEETAAELKCPSKVIRLQDSVRKVTPDPGVVK